MLIINFILFTGLFYFLYMALFRGKSFFNLNRWLLLSIPLFTLLIALIAPYFNDPVYQTIGFSTNLLPEVLVGTTIVPEVNSSASFNYYFWIYGIGALLSSLLFVKGLLQIISIVRSSDKVNLQSIEFGFSSKADSPFSFFKHIILPYSLKDSKDLPTILNHEKVHQEEKHSSDNLYYNILSILFWFNPFIHLLAKELRQIHECIADKKAIENTSREVYAHMLLSSTFGSEVALPANPFFNPSLLKTRITMLYKNETPKWLRFSYLAVLPLAAAMTLHACSKNTEATTESVNGIKASSISEVDQFPLFENCNTSASKEEQGVCFQTGIFNFIANNLKYPQDAYKLGVEGRVYVGFIFDEKGRIGNVAIKRGITVAEDASSEVIKAAKSLEDYAVTLLQSMPQLKSGAIHDGKEVSVEFTVPIMYKIQSKVVEGRLKED